MQKSYNRINKPSTYCDRFGATLGTLVIASLLSPGVLLAQSSAAASIGDPGAVHVVMRTDGNFDQYTSSPTPAQEAWMNQHYARMTVFSPYFDQRLSWFPNAWNYVDLYAIPTDSPIVSAHPDWILRDSSGNPMYIPWNCSHGTCPLYAGDPGNQDFDNWWISTQAASLSAGYIGMFIDDVNLIMRVGDANGNQLPPQDPRTGATMTQQAWESYVANFTSAIRAAFPGYEIAHNSIWFAGDTQQSNDPYVIQEINAADVINCERGISDSGLTGGTGQWSVNAFLAFIDHVHQLGRLVILEEYDYNGEYGLAGYYLIETGFDGEGNDSATPDNWWAGYNINLGTPSGARYAFNGLLRRDFSNGLVLLSPPGTAQQTVALPRTYARIDGSLVTSVTLSGGQGAVLLAVN